MKYCWHYADNFMIKKQSHAEIFDDIESMFHCHTWSFFEKKSRKRSIILEKKQTTNIINIKKFICYFLNIWIIIDRKTEKSHCFATKSTAVDHNVFTSFHRIVFHMSFISLQIIHSSVSSTLRVDRDSSSLKKDTLTTLPKLRPCGTQASPAYTDKSSVQRNIDIPHKAHSWRGDARPMSSTSCFFRSDGRERKVIGHEMWKRIFEFLLMLNFNRRKTREKKWLSPLPLSYSTLLKLNQILAQNTYIRSTHIVKSELMKQTGETTLQKHPLVAEKASLVGGVVFVLFPRVPCLRVCGMEGADCPCLGAGASSMSLSGGATSPSSSGLGLSLSLVGMMLLLSCWWILLFHSKKKQNQTSIFWVSYLQLVFMIPRYDKEQTVESHK